MQDAQKQVAGSICLVICSFLTPGLAGSLLYFAVLSLKCKQIPNSFGFYFKTTPCEGPKVVIFTGVKSLM